MSQTLIYGMVCFIFCHIFVWFGNSLQFFSDWWRDRPLLTIALFSMPISMLGYYGMRFTYHSMGDSLWSARFIGYATSFLVFPFLTWWFLHETMFTTKTMICIGLSMVIMAVQLFWK